MKNIFQYLIVVSILLAAGCVDFPTSYSVIETEKPRLLDFIYEPAEAAPGDTVHVTALFAGKTVSADDVEWSMSRKIVFNEYGSMSAPDTQPLPVQYDDRSFSDNTSCLSFLFVIPEQTLREAPAIPDTWKDLLPDYYRTAIPPSVPSSKASILTLLDEASTPQGAQYLSSNDSITAFMPMLLQLFSAPVYIFCRVKDSHLIRSSYIVRYNSRFADAAGSDIPVNRNPVVDSMFLYCIDKPDIASFDPIKGNYPYTRTILRGDSVNAVSVDNHKSYFIGIYNSRIDTTESIDASMGASRPLTETITGHWYIEYRDTEKKETNYSDLMTIEDGFMYGNLVVSKFYPPLDDKITAATCWVELDDSFLNEMNRPTGSTVGELRMSFSYGK